VPGSSLVACLRDLGEGVFDFREIREGKRLHWLWERP